jgi:NADH-ubiquinone oxidoreductase chain 5
MAFPLMVLCLGSIFVGYIMKDLMVGMGTPFWGNAILTLPEHQCAIEAEFLPLGIKLIPLVLSFSGAGLSVLIYHANFTRIGLGSMLSGTSGFSYNLRSIYTFLNRKWMFDRVQNELVVSRFMWFGYNVSYKLLDKGIVEVLGPKGLSQLATSSSKGLRTLQSGYIFHYAFWLLLAMTFLVAFVSSTDSEYISAFSSLTAFVDPRVLALLLGSLLVS